MKCNKCGKGPSDSCVPFQGHDFPDGDVVSAMKRKLEANQRNLGMVMKENRENLERAEKAEAIVVELREAIVRWVQEDDHLPDCPFGENVTGIPDHSGNSCSENCQEVTKALDSSTDAGKKEAKGGKP